MQLTKVDSNQNINNISNTMQLMSSKSKLKLKKKFLLSPQRNGVPILPNIQIFSPVSMDQSKTIA